MRVTGENIKVELSNGLILNYDDNGPAFAPAVIFMHGTPFNKSVWDLQAEALKNNYRVIAYDLRGHGRSTGNQAGMDIDAHTADLLALMDELEIHDAILCGLSLGTYIAMDAIEKHPERFNAMVLSGVQCMTDTPEIKQERNNRLARLNEKGIDAFVDDSIRIYFSARAFTSRKEEVRAVRDMMLHTKPETIKANFHTLDNRREYCSRLPEIKVPVLILMGREDTVTPLSLARNVQDKIRGSDLYAIEYAGHLVNLENTHEYNVHLKQFVDTVCRTRHLSRHCAGEVSEETTAKTGKLKV